ncbi:MAG: DUF1080 domain-containing protein [Planctomycetota bacterium]
MIRRQNRIVALVVATLAVVAPARAGSDDAPNGTAVHLFDGESFAGWVGDTASVWRIEDGAITAGSETTPLKVNRFLCTEREFGDFELTFKTRFTGERNFNGGVQFWSRRLEDGVGVAGFQADISPRYDGCLYDEARRRKLLACPDPATRSKAQAGVDADGWHTFRVRAAGDRIEISLNGVRTAEYVEKNGAIPRSGILALQVHRGMYGAISYKDIEIVELSP